MTLLHQAAQKAVESAVSLAQIEELAKTMWKGEPVPGRVLRFGAAVLGLVDAALQHQEEPPVHIDVERMNRALRGPRILIPDGLNVEEVVAFITDHADRMAEQDGHQEVPREPVADFDTWQQNPYTKVLMDSIKNDYMPRADAEALIRAAASPSTTRQQEVGSFDKTGERINALAKEAGFHMEPMTNMLYTVRGNHAQLVNFARLVLAAAPSTPEKAGGVSDAGVMASADGWVEAGLVCQACAGDAPGGKCRNPKCVGGPIMRELVPAEKDEPSPIPHPLPAQANDGGEHG